MMTQIDPVCGARVSVGEVGNESAPVRVSEFAGGRYFFCSDHCKQSFDRAQREYAVKRDPVCGAEVHALAELASEYERQWYYFCSPQCRINFVLCPGFYAALARGALLPVNERFEDRERAWE